ncbi:hypothetical protein QR680_010982 [Steinernema hermaphroditum]|uniref:Uncharacterized protein n=1 Tax=Steinernema hermaphroditum TaxID=289476 RepID=A0AA39IS46_9BILA|nr:hypothetical protein QR680_010982 [Steinernema hermaphroditum]
MEIIAEENVERISEMLPPIANFANTSESTTESEDHPRRLFDVEITLGLHPFLGRNRLFVTAMKAFFEDGPNVRRKWYGENKEFARLSQVHISTPPVDFEGAPSRAWLTMAQCTEVELDVARHIFELPVSSWQCLQETELFIDHVHESQFDAVTRVLDLLPNLLPNF